MTMMLGRSAAVTGPTKRPSAQTIWRVMLVDQRWAAALYPAGGTAASGSVEMGMTKPTPARGWAFEDQSLTFGDRGPGAQAELVPELLVLCPEHAKHFRQLLVQVLGLVQVARHLVRQPQEGGVFGDLVLDGLDELLVVHEEAGQGLFLLLRVGGEPGAQGLHLGYHVPVARLDEPPPGRLVQVGPQAVDHSVQGGGIADVGERPDERRQRPGRVVGDVGRLGPRDR